MFDFLCAPIDKGCDNFAKLCMVDESASLVIINVRDSNIHKNVLLTKNSVQSLMVC